ncbi:MAG TPA: pantoate--beta-alanine ligase [Acidobacteriaceae bacterium]|jgi:pantoate--beta-alanine ligase
MSSLQPITTITSAREASTAARKRGSLALVPTMGALHEGHLSLVRAARRMCDSVAVSIFVNPLQFGPTEDLARYPRTLAQDIAMLERENVDFVFAPTPEEIYPQGTSATFVEVGGVSDRLDGKTRPGHFRGVATVVAKLFNILSPDVAFFGQKDAAQVAVLKAMVRDLNFPVRLEICPTVREADGLAMSSRNRYLSEKEREQALVLHRSLEAAAGLTGLNGRDAATVQLRMLQTLEQEPAVVTEYAEVVDAETLLPIDNLSGGALLAVAARVGQTRLIDNIVLPANSDGAR